MRGWVGITDGDWFETLHRLQPDEVNLKELANIPDRLMDRPGREFLDWHNKEVNLA